jgi:hypothetical protein
MKKSKDGGSHTYSYALVNTFIEHNTLKYQVKVGANRIRPLMIQINFLICGTRLFDIHGYFGRRKTA